MLSLLFSIDPFEKTHQDICKYEMMDVVSTFTRVRTVTMRMRVAVWQLAMIVVVVDQNSYKLSFVWNQNSAKYLFRQPRISSNSCRDRQTLEICTGTPTVNHRRTIYSAVNIGGCGVVCAAVLPTRCSSSVHIIRPR